MRARGWWLEVFVGLALASCTPRPAPPRPVAAPVAKPTTPLPTAAPQAGPIATALPPPDCPSFKVTKSSWLNVIDGFRDLDSMLQDEAPRSPMPHTKNPCGPAVDTCKDWARFDGDYARWEYTVVAGKIIAVGLPRAPDDVAMILRVVGDYVVGARRKEDYFCPDRPTDDCYPYSSDPVPEGEPEPMSCESDGHLRCVRDGERLDVQILNVPKLTVYTGPEFRHVKDWEATPRADGRLRLKIDACVVEPN